MDSDLSVQEQSGCLTLYERKDAAWVTSVSTKQFFHEKLPEYFGRQHVSLKRFFFFMAALLAAMTVFFIIYPWKFFRGTELSENTVRWIPETIETVPTWAERQTKQIQTTIQNKNYARAFVLVGEIKDKIVFDYFDTPQGSAFLDVEKNEGFQSWLLEMIVGIPLELAKSTSGTAQKWYYRTAISDYQELTGNPFFFKKNFHAEISFLTARFLNLDLNLLYTDSAPRNPYIIDDFLTAITALRQNYADKLEQKSPHTYVDMMEAYALAARLTEYTFGSRFTITAQNISRWKRFCALLDNWKSSDAQSAMSDRDFLTLSLFKWETIDSLAVLPWQSEISLGNQHFNKEEAKLRIGELKKLLNESNPR